MNDRWRIVNGDCLSTLMSFPAESVDCCVTSPPYWGLRDYGVEGQLGMELNPEEYIKNLVEVMEVVKRVLKPGGTLWLNLGDSYSGSGKGTGTGDHKWGEKQRGNMGARILHKRITTDMKNGVNRITPPPGFKAKDLMGLPWRVAFALQKKGWYLRQDIIWYKTNCMPESVKDRCTKAHEYVFLLSKSRRYYFNHEAIKEVAQYGGSSSSSFTGSDGFGHQYRSKRSVWSIPNKSFKGAHFATFPEKLVEPCILAGSPQEGLVLDPFSGSGTTGVVALGMGRGFVGIELNPEYVRLAENRIRQVNPVLQME